jgi:hypothetical protein
MMRFFSGEIPRLEIPAFFNILFLQACMQEMTGYAGLASFLERNPEISIRQGEGLSLSRAQGMNREEINNFFKCWKQF